VINRAKTRGTFGIEIHTYGNPHGSRGNRGNVASRFYEVQRVQEFDFLPCNYWPRFRSKTEKWSFPRLNECGKYLTAQSAGKIVQRRRMIAGEFLTEKYHNVVQKYGS
jgi:hypothetical protein